MASTALSSLSKQYQAVIEKRIADRKKYHTDPVTGRMKPFLFILEGTGTMDRTVEPPRAFHKDAYLDGKTIVYDLYDKVKPLKTIRNVTSEEPKWDDEKGKEVIIETVEMIKFTKGYCYVQEEEVNKLAYLIFADGNMSKPRLMLKTGAMPTIKWYEDRSSLYSSKANNEISEIKLLSKALEVAQRADLQRMKEVLTLVAKDTKYEILSPEGKMSDVIENDFFVFAKNHPRAFLNANVDDRTKTEILVTELLLKGIVTHDTETASYYGNFYNSTKPQKLYSYNKVTSLNPEKDFVDYLLDAKNEPLRTKLSKTNKPSLHPYLFEGEEKVESKELELA